MKHEEKWKDKLLPFSMKYEYSVTIFFVKSNNYGICDYCIKIKNLKCVCKRPCICYVGRDKFDERKAYWHIDGSNYAKHPFFFLMLYKYQMYV